MLYTAFLQVIKSPVIGVKKMISKSIKKYWWICLLTSIMVIAETVVDLLQPDLMADIIDEGVLKGDLQIIISLGIRMIIIVLLIMLFAVLPSFSEVYKTLTGNISSGSYAYINIAYIFCWVVLGLMVLLVAAVIIGLLMWRGNGKRTVEKVLAKNKTCAALLEDMALYRFTSAYEVYLASGAMQDEAVIDALKMVDYEPVEKKIRQVIRRMEEGVGFAQAANDIGLYEPIYCRMLIPGERSGNTDDVLRRLNELLANDCADRTEKLTGTIEPLLSGILMITIAIALLSVMLPLIGIMNSIG